MTDEKLLMIKIKKENHNFQDFMNYIFQVKQLLDQKPDLNLLKVEKIYSTAKFCYIAIHRYECNLFEALLYKKFSSIQNVVQLLLKVVEAYINTFSENGVFKSHNCLNYENILLINSKDSDEIKICFRDTWASPELNQVYQQIVLDHNIIKSKNQNNQQPMLSYIIAPEIQQYPQAIGSSAADMFCLGQLLNEVRYYNEAVQKDALLIQLFNQMMNQYPNERITWQQLRQQLLTIQASFQYQPNNQIKSNQFPQSYNSNQQFNTSNTKIIGNQMNNQFINAQQSTHSSQQNILSNNQQNMQLIQTQQYAQYQNPPSFSYQGYQAFTQSQQNIFQINSQNQQIPNQAFQMQQQQNNIPVSSQNYQQFQGKQNLMQALNNQGTVNQFQQITQQVGQQTIVNQQQQQQQQVTQNYQQQTITQNQVIQSQSQNQNNMMQQQSQQIQNAQNLLTWQAQQNEYLNLQAVIDQIKQQLQGYEHLADSFILGEEAMQFRNISLAFKELFYEFTKDDIYQKYNLENAKVIEFLVCVLQFSYLYIKKSKELANLKSIELGVIKIFDRITSDFKDIEYIKKKYIDDLKKDFPEQLYDDDPDYKLLFSNSSDGRLFEQTLKQRMVVNFKQMEVELISLKVKQKYKNNNHINGLCFRIEKLKEFNSLIWNKQQNTTFNFKLYYEKLNKLEQSNQ
ncbi:hypothetical protein ABPG72_010735 [Tetrahymena utriculariae]